MHSLLIRLLAIVAAALTPVALLQIDSAVQTRQTRQQLMQAEAIRLVRLVGEEQQRILEGADQVLTAMGSTAFVLHDHLDICRNMLANLEAASPRYLTAKILAADGYSLCAPPSSDPAANFSERAYFRLAMQTGQFTVGEFTVGWETGKPTIHLAKPFKYPNGAIAGVAVVALSLDWLAEQLGNLALPQGAVANVRDRNGTLLARYPNVAGSAGQPMPEDRRNTLNGEKIGTGTNLWSDGRQRFSAYAPVGTLTNGMRVVVGLDAENSFAAVSRANDRDLVLIACAFALALGATALLGAQLIRRPVQRLLAVADQWRAGDLSARTNIPNTKGEFGRLAAAFDAMAEAQQAREAALRESEQDYRATFEQSSVGMTQTALDGTLVRVNDALCAIKGRSREEMIGHRFREFTHPDDRAADKIQMLSLLSGEVPTLSAEKRYVRKDGSIVWVDRWASLLRDQSGHPSHIITIAEDITARKAVQTALEESQTRLQLAREAAGFGVWDVDLATNRAYWSEEQWRQRGLEPDPDGIDTAVALRSIHPDDQSRVWNTLQAAIADPALPAHSAYRIIRPDGGTRWLDTKAKVVRDQHGKAVRVVGLSIDITEARETDAQLRRLTTDLEARVQEEVTAREAAQRRAAHAERLQALGQLAGGVAHDFNNVLQMVIGASTLIEDDPNDAKQVGALAHLITEAAERGSAITRRLLTVGRHGDLRAETLNVTAVLTGLREIFVHTLGSGITVDVRIDDQLPDLLADKAQLETSLINLAANARDAMPNGGRLLITAATEIVHADQIAHPAGLATGGYVRLGVSDNGSGMDAATLAHVGEPFFTTKKAGAGTGLGVAIVKGFAEQSGGGIDIVSQRGLGTMVTLWLPTAADEQSHKTIRTPNQAIAPPAESPARPASSVLLVDDEALVRRVLAQHLARSGFQVLVAANGAEALAILDSNVKIDALVSDLSMPGMDGLTLIRAAQERLPRLSAILLTGYASDGVSLAINGAINGSYSLLRKPVTGLQLVERVRVLLATQSNADT